MGALQCGIRDEDTSLEPIGYLFVFLKKVYIYASIILSNEINNISCWSQVVEVIYLDLFEFAK